jgi:hypothetical protein
LEKNTRADVLEKCTAVKSTIPGILIKVTGNIRIRRLSAHWVGTDSKHRSGTAKDVGKEPCGEGADWAISINL